MSDGLGARSHELLEQTRSVLDALESSTAGEEVDRMIERQREAFNDFSRHCDRSVPLDAQTRRNVDCVLQLEQRIVELADRARVEILEQRRRVANRRSQARAFQTQREEPPRFVTQRV